MKLSEYIRLMRYDELTVWDEVYDIEVYFYKHDEKDDLWDKAVLELEKLVNVVGIKEDGVIVDFHRLIESKLKQIEEADIFYDSDLDSIMLSLEHILSGNVSEKSFVRFIKILKS